MSLSEIEAEALLLTTDQRLALAQRILTSIEPVVSSDIDDEWELEIKARISQLDAGLLDSAPADEVFIALDRHLSK